MMIRKICLEALVEALVEKQCDCCVARLLDCPDAR